MSSMWMCAVSLFWATHCSWGDTHFEKKLGKRFFVLPSLQCFLKFLLQNYNVCLCSPRVAESRRVESEKRSTLCTVQSTTISGGERVSVPPEIETVAKCFGRWVSVFRGKRQFVENSSTVGTLATSTTQRTAGRHLPGAVYHVHGIYITTTNRVCSLAALNPASGAKCHVTTPAQSLALYWHAVDGSQSKGAACLDCVCAFQPRGGRRCTDGVEAQHTDQRFEMILEFPKQAWANYGSWAKCSRLSFLVILCCSAFAHFQLTVKHVFLYVQSYLFSSMRWVCKTLKWF